MSLKVNACTPGFGTVSNWAIRHAREKNPGLYTERLIEEQKQNLRYDVVDTIDSKLCPCFGVKKNDEIIARFNSFEKACAFATAAENAEKENGAF